MNKSEFVALLIGAASALSLLCGSNMASLAICFGVGLACASLWLLGGTARWLGAFFCAAVLLPPLPLPWGDSGPHPALAIALVGLLAGLAHRWKVQLTALTLSLLIFTAVNLCSSAFAALYSGPWIALGSTIRALLFGIGVYVFFFTQSEVGDPRVSFRMVQLLFGIASLAALFACLDFYYQFPAPSGFSPQFVWLDAGVFRRAQGLFYDASTLGNFCAFFLIMIGASLVRPVHERPISVGWMIPGGTLLGAAMVLSYSRASVVNVLVSTTVLWAITRRGTGFVRPTAIGIASVGSVVLAGYLLVPHLFSAYLLRLWNSMIYLGASTDGVLSGRLSSWNTITSYLLEHPWHLLSGIGYKTLHYSGLVGTSVISDNNYLSALIETGFIGLAALLFLLAAILRTSYRAARQDGPIRSFFGTWTFCFWCGQAVQMLSGDLLTFWRVLPIYFWVLAVAAE